MTTRRKRPVERWMAGFLCALIGFVSGYLPPGPLAQVRALQQEEERTQEVLPRPAAVSLAPEAFREQLVTYLRDSEEILSEALNHPLIGPQLSARLGGAVFQIPIPRDVYDAIEALDYEELDELRGAFAKSPGILGAPTALSVALAELDRQPVQTYLSKGRIANGAEFADSCGTNYAEWDNVLSKRSTVRALVRAQGGLELGGKIAQRIGDVLRASLEDVPPFGSKLMVVLYVIWGVTHISQAALGIAGSALELDMAESQLCIDSCLSDSADPSHPSLDSGVWRGKGCDNRDNNCDSVGVIDEPSEDRFKPEVSIDSSALLECYASQAVADAVARRAVTASDDCKLAGPPTVNVTAQTCAAMVTAQATDMGSPANMSTPKTFSLKVDGVAPVIGMPALDACYATVADAHAALAATSVTDACSAFSTMIRVAEKECDATLELEAVDECGNRSLVEGTVRVDGAPPEVRIETLTIPSVEGLSCFASQAGAVATVTEATQFSDNCTAADDLILATTTTGDACNLTVTQTVTDECGGSTTSPSSDSLLVRVDTQPPVISCSVTRPTLWPADDKLTDIGFQLSATDNCDPQLDLDVLVTSDEPTHHAHVSRRADDPFPDAVVERTPSGGIQRILLRAQRRTTDVDSFDGRVYRIRVVATDACGLSSQTECWVGVPATSESASVNNGQKYDATVEN